MSIVTISRQAGAGGRELARRLAEVLGYELLDRELLHQQAAISGIAEPALYRMDESAPSFWERMARMDASAPDFRALEDVMRSLGARDRVIVVGRGANLFLRDHPRAYHIGLVAGDRTRIRRIMAERWVNEAPAQEIMVDRDSRRGAFLHHYFHVEADSPLLYHAVYNTSLLDVPVVASLVAAAVRRQDDALRVSTPTRIETETTPT